MNNSNNNNGSKAVFGIFAMVFVFFIILVLFAFYTMNAFNETTSIDKMATKAHLGVIEVEGIIMDSKDTVELLQMAEEDKQIEAIIIRVNSPGGAVGPTQEIYQEIIRIDKIKPVYASFAAIAASGGYYIGAATRKIWANPGTLTGSIGVIMEFLDLSKLYEFAKVAPKTIKAGRYKDAGNPSRSLTLEETTMMDNLISGVHQQFINDIMNKRKDIIKGDINELAQGQIFTGDVAFKNGLVDELGSLWTAGRAIHRSLKIKGEFGIKYIKKKKHMGIFDLVNSLDEALSKLNISSLVHNDKSPLLMFK